MKVVEAIGTIQIMEVASGQYIAKCPFCGIGGNTTVGETAKNIFVSMMRQTGGWHTNDQGKSCDGRPAPEEATGRQIEFVAHMKCGHWIAAYDVDGTGKRPASGEAVICPACDAYCVVTVCHEPGGQCSIGGCEEMDIVLTQAVMSNVIDPKKQS